ncbi:glycosyltransferase [Galbibacter sp. EGI 63066]|uniref:glycosyltransferase n=1 Tax=Galbibacter sp. EGI 63066 TaxID=2993559 RepID=UPI0022490135|nr:glycosyltransferase [Galbibacter sp. EGI 63066]MCX2681688.1 glycosyltransferase [Galbibacter sp. EGI 63066]
MELNFSFIIPVYNRPEEIKELLSSMESLSGRIPFEVVIVEDGSTISSEEVVKTFQDKLNISYYFKENSGPGDSRNYGMRKAQGNYFVILDSDCILPPEYLEEASKALNEKYVDCYGGPDAAHESFSDVQKAINYSMTAILTTGGIRGGKKAVNKFQPRSFNMGLSRKAFESTGGFGKIHPGEDPDLTIRLWKNGFETVLIEKAFVYHKRRISWEKFYQQVTKFGLTRPILNKWHPETQKITYWFPSLFTFGLLMSVALRLVGITVFLYFYFLYFLMIWIDALLKYKNLKIAFMSVYAVLIQFFAYGFAFAKSTFLVTFSGKKPEEIFPKLFFS